MHAPALFPTHSVPSPYTTRIA